MSQQGKFSNNNINLVDSGFEIINCVLIQIPDFIQQNGFKHFSACYILSGFLDAFDGHAARAFNQSTKFGAMLDMLTDR